jgi:5-methylcytosine-specific restriction endonuclease McrA
MAGTAWAGSTWTPPLGWERLRAAVLQRDGHRCTWTTDGTRCPLPATDVDHVTPRHLGGADTPTNLQSLCPAHHARKSSSEGVNERAKRAALRRRPIESHPGMRAPSDAEGVGGAPPTWARPDRSA